MRLDDVIQHFDTAAAASRALNIKQPSLAEWSERIPALRQLQIEELTHGELRADPEALEALNVPPYELRKKAA
jgi:hypothetical protein